MTTRKPTDDTPSDDADAPDTPDAPDDDAPAPPLPRWGEGGLS